ncbi:hypothetical protein [Akkermansia sp.]|uniref:hypothetical protein n=1 Tax=Akkermansia sp. TaxID=1872421 RepID=UPI003AB87B91
MSYLEGYSSTTPEDIQGIRDLSAKLLRDIRKLAQAGDEKGIDKKLASFGIIIKRPNEKRKEFKVSVSNVHYKANKK